MESYSEYSTSRSRTLSRGSHTSSRSCSPGRTFSPTRYRSPIRSHSPSGSSVVTKYYREYPDFETASQTYIDEHDALRLKIKHQAQLIEQMTKRLRDEREKRINVEDEKFSSLSELVNMRTRTIRNLEQELESWETRVSDMHHRYSSLRNDQIKKEYSMERLRDELKQCSVMLEDAVSGKMNLEMKLEEMEAKRKKAEYEYNKLYELNNNRKQEKKTTYTVVKQRRRSREYQRVPKSPTRRGSVTRKDSITSMTSNTSKGTRSPYGRILVPYHLHALDLIDVRDVYKESWRCDICSTEKHPGDYDQESSYPYHCYLCNYDACQMCVERMDGAVVTDHFTYFTH